MPPSKRIKLTQDDSPQDDSTTSHPPSPATTTTPPHPSSPAPPSTENEVSQPIEKATDNELPASSPPSASNNPQADRLARFKTLRTRAQQSSQKNLKEAALESQRLSTDPSALSTLSRKKAIASHNLLKADTEAAGDDFERKRAWDWTIEESEKWDERMEGKRKNREDVAFQDYTQDARKIYERQVREMEKVDGKARAKGDGAGDGGEGRREAYEREKAEQVLIAARSGGLEIVETEDGELVAVDRSGTFGVGGEIGGGLGQKPEKKNVDRLVGDLKKAEETRLRKRRERRGGDEGDEDVTFINEKNKQFNQKLARFYNKYTAEIRESFERGTMI